MIQTVITRAPFERTTALLSAQFASLTDSGSFFAIVSTEYDARGNAVHDFLELIGRAVAEGYAYVNTIVYPAAETQEVGFLDNVRYVVWLCKDRAQMRFCKDAIREKHIWKDVEWGKREKNYNPKGKDPGNVWIPTDDDGRGHITWHIRLSDEEVVDRLTHMADCGESRRLFIEELPHAILPLKSAAPRPTPADACADVVFGSSESMDAIPDGSVDVIVTSPPYWDLKDYFKEGQIGQEPYELYLARMNQVWGECRRVLRPEGSLWVNVNIRSHAGQVIPIPADFVRLCRAHGFFYRGILIWHKSSGIPTGEKNIVDRHEYVLIFSANEDFCVDKAGLSRLADYTNDGINGRAFWNINRKAGSVGKKYRHPAIFPNDLVRRIVEIASPPGGLVLDPFLGSGTSLIASIQAGRRFIGYEFNDGFQTLMQTRFDAEIPQFPVAYRRCGRARP